MTKNRPIKITLISIFSAVLFFHVLVLTGVVPYKVVWGGRLTSHREMVLFETVSMLLNGLFLYIILLKATYLRNPFPDRLITVVLWAIIVLFGVNTVGNLMAVNPWERYLATPITLTISILVYVIVREK